MVTLPGTWIAPAHPRRPRSGPRMAPVHPHGCVGDHGSHRRREGVRSLARGRRRRPVPGRQLVVVRRRPPGTGTHVCTAPCAPSSRTLAAHCALAGIAHEPAALLAQELLATAPRGPDRASSTPTTARPPSTHAVKICAQGWEAAQQAQQDPVHRARRRVTRRLDRRREPRRGRRVPATVLRGHLRVRPRPVPPPPTPSSTPSPRDLDRCCAEESASIAGRVRSSPSCRAPGDAHLRPRVPARPARALRRARRVARLRRGLHGLRAATGPACGPAARAGIAPDIIVAWSKALLGCIVPMGAVLASARVFDAFRARQPQSAPCSTGTPSAATPWARPSRARCSRIYRDERVLEGVARKAPLIARAFERIAALCPASSAGAAQSCA